MVPRSGVLGQAEVDGADDVVANWEEIKKAEKGRASVFDGIPTHLPALLYALKVHKKAATVGLDVDAEVPSLPAAVDALAGADAGVDADEPTVDDRVGDLLLAAVAAARAADVDPEAALRSAAAHLRDRARAVESSG